MPFETAAVQAPAHPQAGTRGYETPLLALALPRGNLPASLEGLDKEIGGAINRVLAAGDFIGKKDETAVIYPSGPASRVLLVGLGKSDEVDRTAAKTCRLRIGYAWPNRGRERLVVAAATRSTERFI